MPRQPRTLSMCINIHIRKMPSRNLAVKEEVYRRLLEAKKGSESFSEVIDRLLQGRSDLMSFAGALARDREFDAVLKDVEEVRRRTVLRR